MKVVISDTFVWFDEVILLELRCMVDSMAEKALIINIEMDAVISYEYS